jgi:NAD(P)-dependent dehydrogenase (short-subunit alcohol dehydrogenase family)
MLTPAGKANDRRPASTAFRLDGEVALITGGGSGLGLGMPRCLARAGATVVILGRREAPLREASAGIGARATYVVADIGEFAKVEAVVDGIAGRVGPISILVNNAGNHLKQAAVDTTVEAFGEVIDTHVLAAHNLSRHVLPDDIGWAAVYLCSPAARFVTGILLPVDGGASRGF